MQLKAHQKAEIHSDYLRIVNGLTAARVGEITGCEAWTVRRYEKGERLVPFEVMREVAAATGKKISASVLRIYSLRLQWQLLVNDKGETVQTCAPRGSKQRLRDERPALIERAVLACAGSDSPGMAVFIVACGEWGGGSLSPQEKRALKAVVMEIINGGINEKVGSNKSAIASMESKRIESAGVR